jgi:hypothetical protein
VTSDKTRKTAIRQRMAVTGEPYSVARKAADAGPADPSAASDPQAVLAQLRRAAKQARERAGQAEEAAVEAEESAGLARAWVGRDKERQALARAAEQARERAEHAEDAAGEAEDRAEEAADRLADQGDLDEDDLVHEPWLDGFLPPHPPQPPLPPGPPLPPRSPRLFG